MVALKVTGALDNPKGITMHSKLPLCVRKTILCMSRVFIWMKISGTYSVNKVDPCNSSKSLYVIG